MDYINIFLTKAKIFFSTYKWLLIPLIPIIIFIYFIVVIIATNQTKKTLPNQPNTAKVSQSPAQNEISPETQASVSPSEQTENALQDDHPYGLYDEVQGVAFGKNDFLVSGNTDEDDGEGYGSDDEFEDGSMSEQTLSDGSVEYKYQSDDPQRPHMQLVKNGVVLFRRNLMPDTTLSYYSDYLTNPPYTSQGSSYFGPNAIIIANPASGIAVVYNPQSNQVYEQYLFPAMSVADYVKKFGSDITAFTPAP